MNTPHNTHPPLAYAPVVWEILCPHFYLESKQGADTLQTCKNKLQSRVANHDCRVAGGSFFRGSGGGGVLGEISPPYQIRKREKGKRGKKEKLKILIFSFTPNLHF